MWTKQVRVALLWIWTFLTHRADAMSQVHYDLSYHSEVLTILISIDASLSGLEGTLAVGGIITEHFASDISPHDVARFKMPVGDDRGQQLWEALAILVALRLWHKVWRGRRCKLMVRSDSMSALISLAALKSKGEGIQTIAMELALDIGSALYRPGLIVHTPGVSNVVPDYLSRLSAPGPPKSPPAQLAGSKLRTPPTRGPAWWLSDHPLSLKAKA